MGDLDRSPAFRGSDHGREHELEDRLLAPCVGDDLEPAALFDEKSFKQIGRPGRSAMSDRRVQMRDAGLEVIHEAGHRAGIVSLVVGDQVARQIAGNGP